MIRVTINVNGNVIGVLRVVNTGHEVNGGSEYEVELDRVGDGVIDNATIIHTRRKDGAFALVVEALKAVAP